VGHQQENQKTYQIFAHLTTDFLRQNLLSSLSALHKLANKGKKAEYPK
jgi:hypothetical protein